MGNNGRVRDGEGDTVLQRRSVRTLLALLLLATLGTAAWIVFAPSNATPHNAILETARWLRERGVPARIADGDVVDFVLNIVLFGPLGFVGLLLWRRPGVLGWTALGCAASSGVEAYQLLALPARSGSFLDILANTAGALVGAALARLLTRLDSSPA